MVQVTKLKNSLLKYCLLRVIVCLFVRNDVVHFNAVACAFGGIHMFTHTSTMGAAYIVGTKSRTPLNLLRIPENAFLTWK